jgi:hypothetical protein
VFHLVGNAANGLTYADLESVIEFLNKAFSNNTNSQEFVADDAQITFCLASVLATGASWPVTTNGVTEYGVQRYNTVYNNIQAQHHIMTNNATSITVAGSTCNGAPRSYFQGLNSFNNTHYLNIYVITNIIDGDCGGTLAGYSSIPGFTVGYNEIYIRADQINATLPYTCTNIINKNTTQTHEVGHYLGLLHTFQGTCSGATVGTCNTEGDHCCDTPPQSSNSGNLLNSNTCGENYFTSTNNIQPFYNQGNAPDMNSNFMGYADCVNTFTDDQVNRIHATIQIFLPSLVGINPSNPNPNFNSTNNWTTSCAPMLSPLTAPIVCYNSVTKSYAASGCTNDEFDLYTINYNSTNVTYNWNFGATNVNVLTATNIHNPRVKYTSAGVYTYTLTITKTASNTTSVTNTGSIVISDCNPITGVQDEWHFGEYNTMGFTTGVGNVNSNTLITKRAAASASLVTPNGVLYSNGETVWVSTQAMPLGTIGSTCPITPGSTIPGGLGQNVV